ncbi:MAG: DNA translocase FtsK [Candidatus Rifleibacteriota bacterium]
MSNKKILLPEGPLTSKRKTRRPRTTTKKKKRKSTTPLPFSVNNRQRSEATGLIMVGFSAFSLSLLHYLSSSKVSGLVNSCMVYLGVGVYILPALIAMMGIQKFMERPFQNLGWRIAGSIGVIVTGLSLLGLEGGKIGVYAMQASTNMFGPVPSKILFFFLFLSSLIFALDILYKDLLAAGVVLAGLTTRLLIFAWELTLALLSMLIEAVKTTSRLINVTINRIKQVFEEKDIHPANQLGKLLSFKPRPEVPDREEDNTKPQTDTRSPTEEEQEVKKPENYREEADENKGDEEDATIIPVPQCWQDMNESQPQKTPDSSAQAISAQINQLPTENFIPVSGASFVEDSSNNNGNKEEANNSEILKDENDDNDELRVIVELENENGQNEFEEDKDYDETAFLEDNRIDQEIKDNEEDYENKQEKVNPYSHSILPPLDLLKLPPPRDNQQSQSDLSQRSSLLLKTLEEFGIKASVTAIVEGPAVSRFELKPAPGIKVSRITSLADDIALALAAQAIRIEAPIPGKPALGIEIPNSNPTPVYFYDLLKNEKFKKKSADLNLALGVTISGKAVFADLAEMPHLLIAGSTGSGKSVCVNTIIASILYQARADQVKFVMIDPKMVELSTYNGIPHLISPVVTDPSKAASALMWAVEEMERRYSLLAECGVRKISTYNEDIERLKKEVDSDLEPMPFIVIIIDELADLMMTASAEVEGSICRLAQMARAVGIHLVIATQRPSVNVLTGVIKANLPTRIAFSVTSAVDSRTILDAKGAERLLGKGDMLFIPKGRNKPLRLQGAFISDRELMDITEFVKSQGTPEYTDIAPENSDNSDDDLSEPDPTQDADAALISKITKYLETQEKTSTSKLQRKFRIGYNRAARIMDQLEEDGMVSPMDGSNKRRVLIWKE